MRTTSRIQWMGIVAAGALLLPGVGCVHAQVPGGSISISTEDGATRVDGVTEIKVANGTLTPNADGSASVATGGGGGITNGDKGHVTVSGTGDTWTIDASGMAAIAAAAPLVNAFLGLAAQAADVDPAGAAIAAALAGKQAADADLTIAAGASDASNSTFFGKNASGTVGFYSVSGSGDVVGPSSAPDNAIVTFDGTTGKLVKNSPVTIDASGNMAGIGSLGVESFTADEMSIPARAAGTTLSGWGEIWLPSPGHVRGTAVTINSAAQAPNDGCAIFADDVEANNWVEWSRLSVPQDYDATADPVATLHIVLSDSDTADHAYKISMVPIAPSAQSASTLANEITLAYTPDASGASGDVQVASATLTGWGAALSGKGGQRWRIRVTRDGDDATNDTSTADSVLVGLSIRYPYVQ